MLSFFIEMLFLLSFRSTITLRFDTYAGPSTKYD